MAKFYVELRTEWGTLKIDDIEAESYEQAESKAYKIAYDSVGYGKINQIEEY